MTKVISMLFVAMIASTGLSGIITKNFEPYLKEGGRDGGRYDANFSDLKDLDHDFAYTWGIDPELSADQFISSAILSVSQISNDNRDPNMLFIHLLDEVSIGSFELVDPLITDISDYFANQGLLLGTYSDLDGPRSKDNLVYEFNVDQLSILNKYIKNGGTFGLGFDPDCHFFNNGVKLTLQVPEPSLISLFGLSLIGLAFTSRKKRIK